MLIGERRETSAFPERLRGDIDHGRRGDKAHASDPAAAPLRTDDEAAGTQVPRDEAAWPGVLDRGVKTARESHGEFPHAWIILALFAVILLAAVLIIWI